MRLQNQVESLLEEAHIKLSSFVCDLLGLSARRMPEGAGEQLCDVLGACKELNVVYRRLLKMALEEFRLIDAQNGQLDQELRVY